MAFYTLIGLLVVAAVLALGVYWVATNLSFKRQSERYTYMKDEAGNDYIRDNSVTPKDEPDAKT
jgi:ABC-type transporter Mla subunit MlaD